jgi:mannose-1-phosphate guanylyltransferase
VTRNSKVCDSQFIVSNTEQYFLALDQLDELDKQNNKYLLEPVGRNTAPAIALACMSLDPDEIVLVTPSDHLIKDKNEYKKVLSQAKDLAKENNLVTFGITPTFAETGFGYIEVFNDKKYSTHASASRISAFSARAFHEKPNQQTAQNYLDVGNYYWNSGMFCFKAGIFLDELKKYSPKIYETSEQALNNISSDVSMTRIKHDDMINIPNDSIDYAVMEKSNIVKVIPSDINWSDVGSFDALFEELAKDKDNNTINKNHISVDSKNNLIYGDERCIATVDIEDLIIVDSGDALLVSKKGSSQKVKQIVSEIRKDTQLHNIHLTGHRPWGTYTILEDSDGYKIKRIEVKPHKRLSLQSHKYRNEHWIVVSGRATITLNDKVFTLNENESTYIKAGDKHRLLNDTNELLLIIEVQVGSYTGEDDIIRFEDDFSRLP